MAVVFPYLRFTTCHAVIILFYPLSFCNSSYRRSTPFIIKATAYPASPVGRRSAWVRHLYWLAPHNLDSRILTIISSVILFLHILARDFTFPFPQALGLLSGRVFPSLKGLPAFDPMLAWSCRIAFGHRVRIQCPSVLERVMRSQNSQGVFSYPQDFGFLNPRYRAPEYSVNIHNLLSD